MSAYKNLVLSRRPIAYYRFAETLADVTADPKAIDSSGNGNHLTYSQSAIDFNIFEAQSRVGFTTPLELSAADDKAIAINFRSHENWLSVFSASLNKLLVYPKSFDTFLGPLQDQVVDVRNVGLSLWLSQVGDNLVLIKPGIEKTLNGDSIGYGQNGYGSIVWAEALGLFFGFFNTGSVFYRTTTVYTSTDGDNWASQTPVGLNDYGISEQVAWSPTLNMFCTTVYKPFVHFRNATSTDGITWTVLPSHGHMISYYSSVSLYVEYEIVYSHVIWAGNKFVFSSEDGNAISYDGVTRISTYKQRSKWKPETQAYSPTLDLILIGGRGSNAGIYTSSDAITWTARSAFDVEGSFWSSHLNKFFCFRYEEIVSSSDGINWQAESLPITGYGQVTGITCSSTRTYVLTGSHYTSTSDGISWTPPKPIINDPPSASKPVFPIPSTKFSIEAMVAPNNSSIQPNKTIVSYGNQLSIKCLGRSLSIKIKNTVVNTGHSLIADDVDVTIWEAGYAGDSAPLPINFNQHQSGISVSGSLSSIPGYFGSSKKDTVLLQKLRPVDDQVYNSSGWVVDEINFYGWLQHRHIVVTWDSADGHLCVYDNGVQVFSQSGVETGQTLTAGQELVIGADIVDAFTRTDSFGGTLDEIAVYDRVLPPYEAFQSYRTSTSNTNNPIVPAFIRVDVPDLTSYERDGWYYAPSLVQATTGVLFEEDANYFNIPLIDLANAVTIEEWLIPSGTTHTMALFDGPVFLRCVGNSLWQFGFGSSLYQGYLPVEAKKPIYVAASHTFGAGQNTFVAINGRLLDGAWRYSDHSVSIATDTNLITTVDLPNLSRVRFYTTPTGSLADPLVANTDYWTIRVSSTTSRLATTRANAEANLFIDITSVGNSQTIRVFEGEALPPFSQNYMRVSLGKTDVIQQLRLSSTAKTIAAVRAYFQGAGQ